jgi:ABC-2 type transport system ATP-binding protein
MPGDDGTGAVAVAVRGLRKRYGSVVAVADVSLDVAQGEIFGVIGPNGSGKTTTVECIQGLRRPDGGGVSVFGHDPSTEPARVRRLVGSQLQESALPDRLKVWEALRLFAAISPGGPPWEQLLDEWGLAEHRRTAFGDLSGGQRQRLFVALALVARPRLVILDEMTTGLDPAARRVAWDLIARVRERGTTIVLVTHFMDEAQRLCDRLAVIRHGLIVAAGTPAELIVAAQRHGTVHFTPGRRRRRLPHRCARRAQRRARPDRRGDGPRFGTAARQGRARAGGARDRAHGPARRTAHAGGRLPGPDRRRRRGRAARSAGEELGTCGDCVS